MTFWCSSCGDRLAELCGVFEGDALADHCRIRGVAATVGATAVFLVARTAIDDGLRVKAELVPHNRR